LILD
jgi:hypothetical protein